MSSTEVAAREGGRSDAASRLVEVGLLSRRLGRTHVVQMLAMSPKAVVPLHDLLMYFLFDPDSAVQANVREVTIMRVAWRTGCSYEWGQHWRVARNLAMPESKLVALKLDAPEEANVLSPEELEAVRLVDGVCDNCGDVAMGEILGSTDGRELVELAGVVATWMWVSVFARVCRPPLDEGLEEWPPDGVGPQRQACRTP